MQGNEKECLSWTIKICGTCKYYLAAGHDGECTFPVPQWIANHPRVSHLSGEDCRTYEEIEQ